MAEILEVIMVLSFGAAWPVSIAKSLKSKTAKGQSPFFLGIIIFGYLSGIVSKVLSGNINYVLFFYFLNLIMVSTNLFLYYRNLKLDRMNNVSRC